MFNWIYAINNIKTDGVACGFRETLEEPGEHHRRGGQSSQSVTCITVCNQGSIRDTSRFFITVQLPSCLNSFLFFTRAVLSIVFMSRRRLSRNSQSTVTLQQVAELMDNPASVTSVSAPATSSTAGNTTLANSVVTASLSASGANTSTTTSSAALGQSTSVPPLLGLRTIAPHSLGSSSLPLLSSGQASVFWPGGHFGSIPATSSQAPVGSLATSPPSMQPALALVSASSVNPYLFHQTPTPRTANTRFLPVGAFSHKSRIPLGPHRVFLGTLRLPQSSEAICPRWHPGWLPRWL